MFLQTTLKLPKSDSALQCLKALTLDWGNTNAPEHMSSLLAFFETHRAPVETKKPAITAKPIISKRNSESERPVVAVNSSINPNIMLVGYINQFVVNTT